MTTNNFKISIQLNGKEVAKASSKKGDSLVFNAEKKELKISLKGEALSKLTDNRFNELVLKDGKKKPALFLVRSYARILDNGHTKLTFNASFNE